MKKKFMFFGTLLIPLLGLGESFSPDGCYIGMIYGNVLEMNQPVDLYAPLDGVGISFSDNVEATEAFDATIESLDGEVKLTYSGYDLDNPRWLRILFGEIFYDEDGILDNINPDLPLGQTYTFRLAAGSLMLTDSEDSFNEEIVFSFIVPEYLPEGDRNVITEGTDGKVAALNQLNYRWQTEIFEVSGSEWEIYRDGDLVRKYPVYSSSDWGLGICWLNLYDGKLNFEDGVDFSILLPQHSVTCWNTEIGNQEQSFDFTGGYTGELPSISMNGHECIYNRENPEVLEKIILSFNTNVSLIASKEVILSGYIGDEPKTWTLVPEMDGGCVSEIMIDVSSIALPSNFILELPEATVVTSEGDIAVNGTLNIDISQAGINSKYVKDIKVSHSGMTLNVSGLSEAESINIVDAAGISVAVSEVIEGSASVNLPGKGIYFIIVTGHSIRKVVI